MNFPENLKKGDTIGICAPSDGVVYYEDEEKLDKAIEYLKNLGYKIIETESVRNSEHGRSTTAKRRAEEFTKLLENDEVKMIIFAAGGDYLFEILDYLNLKKIKKLKPKWMQGFSDITGIEFLWNTVLDTSSIYCDNVKSFANERLQDNLKNALKIASGEKVEQKSFEKCERSYNVVGTIFTLVGENPYTETVKWKNLKNEKTIEMQGRMLGGCIDCVQRFFGTEYDKICEYIEKYKDDGIIWYLEAFEMTSSELTRILWQMKHAGYFKNVTGIIFGRSFAFREDYGISFKKAVKDVLGNLKIPIIYDADIGHVGPQMAIVNGGIMHITSQDGKGSIKLI